MTSGDSDRGRDAMIEVTPDCPVSLYSLHRRQRAWTTTCARAAYNVQLDPELDESNRRRGRQATGPDRAADSDSVHSQHSAGTYRTDNAGSEHPTIRVGMGAEGHHRGHVLLSADGEQ